MGGGASGLICALLVAEGDHEVILLEKNSRVGRKIRASGNGRCNITNRRVDPSCYFGHHPAFVHYALKQFSTDDLVRFFRKLGMEIVAVEDGRMFPMAMQALVVVAFLEYACRERGVRIETETAVEDVTKECGKFIVATGSGKMYADAVVLATGSTAAPALGADGSGWRIAKGLGHRLHDPFAVLVQLQSGDPFCRACKGVKLDAVITFEARDGTTYRVRGDLLFTDYGLSGLAILDISRFVSAALHRGETAAVTIDLLPDISYDALKKRLQKGRHQFGDLPPELWLSGILHQKVVAALLRKTGISERSARELSTKKIQTLAYMIKHLKIKIDATRGAKGAEVMAGGVDCHEVDPKTMESKLVKNLFLTGEILDIDGKRGGYNLHWAFASGYLAGRKLRGG